MTTTLELAIAAGAALYGLLAWALLRRSSEWRRTTKWREALESDLRDPNAPEEL
ncbi:MAG: hypothetical protein ACREC5_04105 [Thermoplasmata archaeon]